MNTTGTTLFPKGLTGIIFDCDGVMLDSRAANNAFYNRILACLGLPPMDREQEGYVYMATVGQSLRHIVPEYLQGQIERVIKEEVSYERDIMPLLRLMPGFSLFIEEMHRRGLRLAVATNRSAEGMQRVLDFFALPPYFNPVITASNAAPKPSPEGALRICESWGTPPATVLFVGDSPNDAMAAHAAGMVFAAFGDDSLQGDLHVADYPALQRALVPCFTDGKTREKE